MAFIVVATDRTTSITPQTGDVVIIKPGVVATSPADAIAGFSVTDLNILCDGIVAGDDNGAELGSGAVVTVGSAGAFLGRSCGIWLNGTGSVLNNAGTIQSLGTGPSFIDAALALNAATGVSITNSGAIIGGGIGIDFTTSIGTRVSNGGTISAEADAITGFRGLSVVNSGTIASSTATAIDLATATVSGLDLLNTGRIEAPVLAIAGTAQADILRNKGDILGDVTLGDGDDRLINRGDLIGDVDLGGGSDRYRAIAAGAADGRVAGGIGNDTLIGGLDGDDFDGGAGSDVLRGDAGDDTLSGSAGSDTLVGGAGDDLLIGGSGNDRFVFAGAFGADQISGFSALDAEKIDLRGVASIVSFADLVNNHLQQVGADAVITDGAGNSVTLANFLVSDLSAGDFIF